MINNMNDLVAFSIKQDAFNKALKDNAAKHNVEFCSATIGRNKERVFWNILYEFSDNFYFTIKSEMPIGSDAFGDIAKEIIDLDLRKELLARKIKN